MRPVLDALHRIFKRRIDADVCEELVDRAYERGWRDAVAYIVANITAKFLKDVAGFGHIAAKLMEATNDQEKRRHMLYCIIHKNANKDRTKCLLRVIGVDPDIIEQGSADYILVESFLESQ